MSHKSPHRRPINKEKWVHVYYIKIKQNTDRGHVNMQVCRARDFQSSEIKRNFVNATVGGELEVWMKRWPKDPQPRHGDVSVCEAGHVNLGEGHRGMHVYRRRRLSRVKRLKVTELWEAGRLGARSAAFSSVPKFKPSLLQPSPYPAATSTFLERQSDFAIICKQDFKHFPSPLRFSGKVVKDSDKIIRYCKQENHQN